MMIASNPRGMRMFREGADAWGKSVRAGETHGFPYADGLLDGRGLFQFGEEG